MTADATITSPSDAVAFTLNGSAVTARTSPRVALTLLDVLREQFAITSAKDGCSPQGQCGCCTVWVDGQPRVACVTPIARVAGRAVTTTEGLGADGHRLADALCAAGGTQCGFCTPGIVMRLTALPAQATEPTIRQALLAHLCRCTGWNTIVDAAVGARDGFASEPTEPTAQAAQAERAAIETGGHQRADVATALGAAGFAADTAPADALVAIAHDGEWVVAETLSAARAASGKVQGRRTTAPLSWPIEVPACPDGEWAATLCTTWVEPGYLEPDAAWCRPGDAPIGPLTNGGAFGGKSGPTLVADAAQRLAAQHQRPVLAVLSREDAVRLGPKRPPMAIGVRSDGTGMVRVARTPGIAAAIRAVAPALQVDEVDVPGPPTSAAIRAAGWAEAAVILARLDTALWATDDPIAITAPNGAVATATIHPSTGAIHITVRAGQPLHRTTLRSYCIGAAHMALGWVRSEAIAVDGDGQPQDLTIRSYGIIRAVDTPPIEVTVIDDDGPPINGGDAVFAAVAAAAWRHAGDSARWPTMRT